MDVNEALNLLTYISRNTVRLIIHNRIYIKKILEEEHPIKDLVDLVIQSGQGREEGPFSNRDYCEETVKRQLNNLYSRDLIIYGKNTVHRTTTGNELMQYFKDTSPEEKPDIAPKKELEEKLKEEMHKAIEKIKESKPKSSEEYLSDEEIKIDEIDYFQKKKEQLKKQREQNKANAEKATRINAELLAGIDERTNEYIEVEKAVRRDLDAIFKKIEQEKVN